MRPIQAYLCLVVTLLTGGVVQTSLPAAVLRSNSVLDVCTWHITFDVIKRVLTIMIVLFVLHFT